jgi:hypothetical protein
MAKFVVEQDFQPIFDEFRVYFRDEIRNRGWRYLIYGGGGHYYLEDVVKSFYENILDFSLEEGRLRVMWDGQVEMVDLRYIATLVGIPVVENARNHQLKIVEYSSIMGPACRIPKDSGIMASTCYRNIMATGRWVCTNITGTSKTSAFYAPTLACIHALMTKDQSYCVVRQLFETICSVKTRHDRETLPLPCLITRICGQFMGRERVRAAYPNAILLKQAKRTPMFTSGVLIDWDPEVIARQEEDVLPVNEDEMSDATFFAQLSPEETRVAMS